MLNTVNVPEQFRPLFEKAQEYVSKYFSLKQEDPSKGTIEIFGERYILVRAASMSVEFFDTIKNLYSSEGEDEAINIARSILFDIAHTLGKMDARNFHKKMNLKDPIEKLSAGPIHFSHSGWAFVDIFPESTPSPDENYCLVYDHPFSFESDAWARAGRTTEFPVCVMNAGYSSGWCEESFGVSLVASEIMCKAKGDEACRFVMAHASRIEQYIQDYLKKTPEVAKRATSYQIPGLFERKWMEEKLRESDANYQTIFNEVNDAIFVHDLDTGSILDVNERMCEMFGYTRTEALTLSVGAISSCEPPYTQKDAFEWIKRAREQGPQVFKWQARHRSGRVFWIEVSLKLAEVMGKDRVLAVVRDITERRQAEQTIQEWKNRYETAVQASGHLLYDWDSETNQVTYGGDLEKILGYTAVEMDGGLKRWLELIHPEDQSYFKSTIEHLIATKEPAHLEFRILKKCGEYIFVEDTGRFITNARGGTSRMLGFVKDITERKRVEVRLKHEKERADLMAREALAASEAKSQFLANMSHEIRTPMNAIIGFSDMLAEEDLVTEQKQYVDTIRDSGHHLLQVIDDILDFSKIEAGQLDTEIIEYSLGILLNSIETLARPSAKEKGLDFKIVKSKELPAFIQTDPSRLRQCLINLINNAIKFTEQGYVHVKISLYEDNDRPLVRFDIEDTGIGIAKNRQQAIFESFTQADGSTTRAYGGTGLGLTVTKQLAELLGGELTLTSEPGNGSVFSLVMPTGVDTTGQPLLDRHDILDQRADESRKADPTMFSGNVLVAEDVEGGQKLMKLMLSKLGVDVVIAEDGRQAIEAALSQSFDLIFMDMQMPHMNGYEATRILKQQGYETPIVALTANAMKGDDQKCVEAGCDDYLTKPMDRRELLRILAKYLPAAQEATRNTIDSAPAQTYGSKRGFPKAQSSEPINSNIREIIDWDQLIERLGDEEIIREIMPSYIKDTKEHFEKLSLAVEIGDYASIASHAHALKGVGRNLSVGQLSDIACQMELAGRENDIETATLLFSTLGIEIEKMLTVLSPYNWIDEARMT